MRAIADRYKALLDEHRELEAASTARLRELQDQAKKIHEDEGWPKRVYDKAVASRIARDQYYMEIQQTKEEQFAHVVGRRVRGTRHTSAGWQSIQVPVEGVVEVYGPPICSCGWSRSANGRILHPRPEEERNRRSEGLRDR